MAATHALAPGRLGPLLRLPRPADLRALLVVLLTAALVSSVVVADYSLTDPFSTSPQDQSASDAANPGSQTVTADQVPEGLTAAEWADIQSQIAAQQAGGATASIGPVTTVPSPIVGAVPEPVVVGPTLAPTAPTLTLPSVAALSAAGVDALISDAGVTITSSSASGAAALSTASIGSVTGAPFVADFGDRVELAYGTVTEYFRTVTDGIEHGYIIDAPVHDGDELVIRLDVTQGTPSLDGADVLITRADGSVVGYRDLYVFDATGAELPSAMGVDGATITLTVDTTGAIYPINVDPTITADATVDGYQNGSGERLGTAIDLSVDTIVVAAPGDDDTGQEFGKVDVYDYNPASDSRVFDSSWFGSFNADSDYGYSVAVGTNRFVVGAPGDTAQGTDAGRVYVYERDGLTWALETILYACTAQLCDGSTAVGFPNYRFGEAVSISDDDSRILVGAPGGGALAGGAPAGGAAYLFRLQGATWELLSHMGPFSSPHAFGASLDLSDDGTLAIIGAPEATFSAQAQAGLAYLYSMGGPGGTLHRTFDPSFGGTTADANFGAAVAIEQTGGVGVTAYVVISEPFLTRRPGDVGGGVGSIFVYDISTLGSGPAPVTVSPAGAFDEGYGFSVAAEDDYIVVGWPYSGTDGDVDIVQRVGLTYTSVTFPPFPLIGGTDSEYGYDVAISEAGNIAGGAPGYDGLNDGINSGAAVAYDDVATPNSVVAESLFSSHGDQFGYTVELDGNRLAVGTPGDDEPLPGSGSVQIFERTAPGDPWVFQTILTDPSPTEGGAFGHGVSLNGGTLAIGKSHLGNAANPGDVYIYTGSGASWTQAPGSPVNSSLGSYDGFGASVEVVDSGIILVGAPENVGGAAYQVREVAGTWGLFGSVVNGGVGHRVGTSIASMPTDTPGEYTVVIGAPASSEGGNIHIRTVDQSTWTGVAVLTGVTTGAWGLSDRVGTSVAADNGRIVVAGYGDGTAGQTYGFHVLEDTGGPFTWSVVDSATGTLTNAITQVPTSSVDIYGGTIALARPGGGGQVDLFRYDGTGWPSTADDTFPAAATAGDQVGFSVALEAETLLAGAPGDDTNGDEAGLVLESTSIPLVNIFTGATNNRLDVGANWELGVTPGVDDHAIVPGGLGIVDQGGFEEYARLYIGAGTENRIGSSNQLTLNGGPAGDLVSDIDGTLVVTGIGQFHQQADIDLGGTLQVDDEVNATAGWYLEGTGASLTGTGTINLDGKLFKDTTGSSTIGSGLTFNPSATSVININDGSFGTDGVADDAGTVNVAAGSFYGRDSASSMLATATYNLEITGDSTSVANYGRVLFSDSNTLAGTIQTTLNGYSPALGDEYVLVECQSGFNCDDALAGSSTPDLILVQSASQIRAFGSATWTGAVDADWGTAGNWNTGQVPGANDVAVIPAGETATVDDVRTVGEVEIGVGALVSVATGGDLTITGGALGDQVSEIDGTLQAVGTGQLTIETSGLAVDGTLEIDTLATAVLANTAPLSITGSGDFDLAGTLNKNGTANVTFATGVAYTTDALGTSITNVNGGILLIDGQVDEYGDVSIASGATLRVGNLHELQSGALVTIAPGGTLAPQSFFVALNGSEVTIEIDGPPPGNVGSIAPAGTFDPDFGTATLSVNVSGYVPVQGDSYTFVSCYGDCSAALGGVTLDIAPFDLGFDDPPGPGSDAFLFIPITTHTWIGGSGPDWSTAANWDTGIVPGANDTAVIPAGETATVTGSETVGAVDVQQAALIRGTISVATGGDLTVTGGTMDLPSTVDGTIDVATSAVLELQGDLAFVGVGDAINVAGELILNPLTNPQAITVGALIDIAAGATLTKAGPQTSSITAVLDLGEDSELTLASGTGDLTIGHFGTWDSGDGTITLNVPQGTTLDMNGNITTSGRIVGDSSTPTPGTVAWRGIANWAAPSGSSLNAMRFLADTGDPTNSSLWQLDLASAQLVGQPFTLEGVAQVSSSNITGTSNFTIDSAATLVMTGDIFGNHNITNDGTIITSSVTFTGVANSLTNNGTIQFARTAGATAVGATWTSSINSEIEVLANAAVDFNTGYTSELGTVRVRSGGSLENSGAVAYGADAEVEIEVLSPATSGSIIARALPTLDPGATLRVIGGYAPLAGDQWIIVNCNSAGSPCPQFTTTDLGLYQQATIANTLVLQPAAQATITVDTLTDAVAADSNCSLREAIEVVNGLAHADCGTAQANPLIDFSVAGTITLAAPLPNLDADMTINGGGAITIDGVDTHEITSVNAGDTVTLEGLTITGGASQFCVEVGGGDQCGAVVNRGDLTVRDTTFIANAPGTAGAALTNYVPATSLTIDGSTFRDNVAPGGTVWNHTGTTTIFNSTFANNSGTGAGAIYNFDGQTLDIYNSTFVDNSSPAIGIIRTGGAGATTTIRNSILSNPGSNNCQTNTSGGTTLTADAFNLAIDATCDSATVVTEADLDLGALAGNGGFTDTVSVGPDSAALGAGDPAVCSAAPVNGEDQRDTFRSVCDVGAFEVTTHVVDNTGDLVDNNPGDGFCDTGGEACSLRAAIEEGNADGANFKRIHFDIPGAGVHTITPATPLPTLGVRVAVDGTSEPGADCGTWPPTLTVEVDFSLAGTWTVASGTSGLTSIRGLVLNGWDTITGIDLTQSGGSLTCNFIGTDASGTARAAELSNTVVVSGTNWVLGGSADNDANVIAAQANRQVNVLGDANSFFGNYLNASPAGVPLAATTGPTNQESFYVVGNGNAVGGINPGEGNVVPGGSLEGVQLVDGTGNSVRGNSISGHSDLGIDIEQAGLVLNGVTPNDAGGDPDAGPNGIQNFPVIGTATDLGGSVQLIGALDSEFSTTYDIDVYANAACHPSGNGEGETYLGSFSVSTNGGGSVVISETLSASVSVGAFITTTATNQATGSTSEFSACRAVTGVGPLIGHWTFDEASSGAGTGTALDAGPFGFDGTINGSATYAPGIVGNGALVLDGSTAYVNVGDQPELDLDTGDYTIAVWVNAEDTLARIVTKDDGQDNDGGYSLFTGGSGCCRITHNNGGANDSGATYATLTANEWHHVAAVYDSSAGEITLYYDGVAQTPPLTVTGGDLTVDPDPDPLLFGAIDNGGPVIQFLDGQLDDLRLYNTALTPTEVQALVDLSCDTTWTGAGPDSLWTTALNWSNGVPGSGIDACLSGDTSDTIEVTGAQTVGSFLDGQENLSIQTGASLMVEQASTLTGTVVIDGTLIADGEVTLTGANTAAGGTLDGTIVLDGNLTVGSGGLAISGAGTEVTNNATLGLTGDLTFSDAADLTTTGILSLGTGSTLTVSATAAGSSIDNTGVLRKTGAGDAAITAANGLALNMGGGSSVEAIDGTLTIAAGGTWDGGLAIDFDVRLGAVVQWLGDNSINGEFTGSFLPSVAPGTLIMGGTKTSTGVASLDFPADPLSPTDPAGFMFELGPATLAGGTFNLGTATRIDDTVTVTGALNAGVTLAHLSGAVTVTTPGTVNVVGTWAVDGGSITGTGTWTLQATGTFQANVGATYGIDVANYSGTTDSMFLLAQDSSVTFNTPVTEGADITIGIGAQLTYLQAAIFGVADWTFEIGGDSTDIANYGRVDFGAVAPPSGTAGSTINTVEVGYSPVPGDSYLIAECIGSGACPLWGTENIGALIQVQAGNNVVLEIPPITNKTESPSPTVGERFGVALDIDGDKAIIGGAPTSGLGTAYIFEYNDVSGEWELEDTLTPPPSAASGWGKSVAIAGEIAAVIDGDRVHIFADDGAGNWSNIDSIVPSGHAVGVSPEDLQHVDATLFEGTTPRVAVATQLDDDLFFDNGALWVFEGGTGVGSWSEIFDVREDVAAGNESNGFFGASMDMDDDLIVVGAPRTPSSTQAGSLWVYRDSGSGYELDELIQSTTPNERLGASVAVADGVIAAFVWDPPTSSTTGTPGVAIYEFDGNSWERSTTLTNSNLSAQDSLQPDVDIFSNIVVLGVSGDDDVASNAGRAATWNRITGSTWSGFVSQGPALEAGDGATDDFFGTVAVGLNGILIGAPGANSGVGADTGAFYTYDSNADVPLPANKVEPFVTSSTMFGEAVSIAGDWALVGFPDVGGSSGSVEVLERNPLTGRYTVAYGNTGSPGTGSTVALTDTHAAFMVDGDTIRVATFDQGNGTIGFPADEDIAVNADAEIDLKGDRLIIGEPGAGTVEIYEFDGGSNWTLQATFTGPAGAFGHDVAIDGGLAVVANTNNGIPGAVSIYERTGPGAWSAAPVDILTPTASTFFGSSVDIDGTTVVVGQQANLTEAGGGGVVYVYEGTPGSYPAPELLTPTGGSGLDTFGGDVEIDGDALIVGASGHEVSGVPFRQGAAFVFQDLVGTWTLVERLLAEDGDSGDGFGAAVSIDNPGGTYNSLVGAPLDDGNNGADIGAVYSYQSTPAAAPPPANQLTSDAPAEDQQFGVAVDHEGDILVVGATGPAVGTDSGTAYAFERQASGAWQFVTELVPSAATIGASYGRTVAIARDSDSGNHLAAIGAPGQDGGDGEVSLWELDGTWSNIGVLSGAAGEQAFGFALDVYDIPGGADDYIVAVGAPDDSEALDGGPGAAYVFNVDTTAPTVFQLAKVLGTDTSIGTVESPEHSAFGGDIAFDGETLLVSAPFNDIGASQAGAVSVLVADNPGLTSFSEQAVLNPCGVDEPLSCSGGLDALFGFGLDLDGDTAVVGATGADGQGRVWVFDRTGSTWVTTQSFAAATIAPGDRFGIDLDIENDVIVVGSSEGGAGDEGEAFVFRNVAGTWTEEATLAGADAAAGDNVGWAVSLDVDGGIVIGGPDVDAAGFDSAGALYTFQIIVGDDPTLTFSLGLPLGSGSSTVANGVGIPISALDGAAPLIEANADNESSVGSTSLQDTGVAESALAGIALGDTPFSSIATDFPELRDLPLLSIGIDEPGGWAAILAADSEYDDLPLVNLTVGRVFGDPQLAGTIAALPFSSIEVNGTPFSSIPFSSIAMGEIPIDQIPLDAERTDPTEIAADWCSALSGTAAACTGPAPDPSATLMSIALSDVPFSSIPFSSIPFSSIPLDGLDATGAPVAAPFSSIPLSQVNLDATPFSSIPFSSIPFSSIPIGQTPFSSIPFSSIPFSSIPFSSIPFSSIGVGGDTFGSTQLGTIPFSSIDVNGAPFSSIPFSSIALADVPLTQIPLDATRTNGPDIIADWCALLGDFGIDCANLDLSQTTVTDVGVRGVPFSSIPFSSIPFSSIAVGPIPFSSIPFSSIPFSSIPLGATDLSQIELDGTPFSSIPFSSIAGPVAAPFSSIPFSSIDVQGSPFSSILLRDVATGSIPFSSIPFSSIPFSSIPFSSIPFSSIPFSSIDLGGTLLSDVPFSSIDILSSPFSSIPFSSIPFSSIDGIIANCALVDCENATLGDAVRAGAIIGSATLGDLEGFLDGYRLPDVADYLSGFTAEDVQNGVTAWADGGAGITLNDILDLGDLALGDLPVTDPLFQQTVLGDIVTALGDVTFADLARALLQPGVADPETELENVVDSHADANGLQLGSMLTFGDVTFGELLPALAGSTLGEMGSFLAFIHLADLGFTPTELATALGSATGSGPGGEWWVIDAVNDPTLNLGDILLADLLNSPDWGLATVRDLIEDLPEEEVAGFTLADLLLGLLPEGTLPWGLAFENVDATEIPGVMPPVTVQAEFRLTGNRERSVEVSVEVPTNAAYVPGSTTVTPALPGDLEPTVEGGRLVWTFSGVEPGPDDTTPGEPYFLDFDVQPTLSIGASSVAGDGRIVGAQDTVASTAFISVQEAFEPNNIPPQAVNVTEDTIYLLHISSDTDIDLFDVTLGENDSLAVDLSGLPADFDLVIYSDIGGGAVATALSDTADGDPLVPVLDPDADGTETIPDQGFPRLDLDPAYPDLALVEISNSRGTEDETIVADRLPAGRYIIQVHGHDGASSPDPAVLQINVVDADDVPVCQARGPLPVATPGSFNLAGLPAGLNTIFLVNEQRFDQLYPTEGGRTPVITALNNLITAFGNDPEISQLGLVGAIVPVDADPLVRDAFARWDDPLGNGRPLEHACNPATANEIVSLIIGGVVDDIRQNHDIEHIVMIGSDDLLPFARLTDATVVANEFDYRHDLTDRNAFTSSFWASTILSDDPYGETAALPFGDRFIYLPDAALGRLLETPAAIEDQIDRFIANDGFLAADSGFVAGYDFLIDGSQAIGDELATIPGISLDRVLEDGTVGPNGTGALWSRQEIFDALIGDPAPGDNGPDIVSFNAHFDHYRALPAEGDQVPGFNENFEVSEIEGIADPDALLDGSLIYSMGCHSGLNVPNTLVTNTADVNTDWAESFTAQEAIYVGNTGFGYGDTETVGYTERLLQLFSRNLATPVAENVNDPATQTSIGQALQFAKQEAFAELPDVSVYHEKALQESTMYGLPFYRLGVAPVAPPAPPNNNPVTDPLTGEPAVSYIATPQNDPNPVGGEIFYSNVDANGDPSTVTQPGRPIQPTLVIDVTDVDPTDPSQLEREARGAIILDMTSSYILGIDPVVSVPVFDEASQAVEPDIDGIVYPTAPQTIKTFEKPEGTRQNLVLATGQYRGTEDAGTQRLDEDIDIVVYYSNDPDRTAPRVLEVESLLTGTQLAITAQVDDGTGTGVDRVYVIVTPNPDQPNADWFGVDLVESPAGSGRWVGGYTFASAPSDIEFLVQVKDEAGNVGVSTNKAVNFGEEELADPDPVTLDITVTPTVPGDPVGDIYRGPVEIAATAGGLPIDYDDGGGFVPFPDPGPLVISDDGLNIVEIRAADGQSETLFLTIDATAPVVTIGAPLDTEEIDQLSEVAAAFSCQDPSPGTCEGLVTGPGGTNVTLLSGDDLPTTLVGTFTLTVTGTDALGNSDSASVDYDVVVPDNVAPLVTITTPDDGVTSVVESAVLLSDFECVDNDSAVTSCTGEVTGPGGGVVVSGLITGAPLPTSPIGSYTLTVTGVDTFGNSAVETATYTVGSADTDPPVITITTPADGAFVAVGAVLNGDFECEETENGPATCVGEVLDPGGSTTGGFVSGDPLPTSSVGTYTLTVTGEDLVGNGTTAMASYTVSAPPSITDVFVPAGPTLVSDDVFVDADFTDADGDSGSYTVTIDYGDADESVPGSTSTTCTVTTAAATVTGNPDCQLEAWSGTDGGVSSTFTYAEPGVYTVTVTVTDESSQSAVSELEQSVVVYDPAGGRVSGAGWFFSDDGSYVDADTRGEFAHFSYRARYVGTNPVPRGRTVVRLVGDFVFRSTSYDYLIIDDTVAVAEGVGRFNGDAGYRFRVQGTDDGSTDSFQVTIWDDTGDVVYDNGVLFEPAGDPDGDEVLLGGIRVR